MENCSALIFTLTQPNVWMIARTNTRSRRSLWREPASGKYPSQIRRIDFEISRSPFLKKFQQWSNLHRIFLPD